MALSAQCTAGSSMEILIYDPRNMKHLLYSLSYTQVQVENCPLLDKLLDCTSLYPFPPPSQAPMTFVFNKFYFSEY